MAVRINNMDMPKRCKDCRFCTGITITDFGCCSAASDLYIKKIPRTGYSSKRPTWCPLHEVN